MQTKGNEFFRTLEKFNVITSSIMPLHQLFIIRDKESTAEKPLEFDFSEPQLFGEFYFFCLHVIKLPDISATVAQFCSLASNHLEWMEWSISSFFKIVQEFKSKNDLNGKLTAVICPNYGIGLTTVQEIFEEFKHIARNTIPVVRNTVWPRRHLLERIEEPLRKFESNLALLVTKDSAKFLKTDTNKVVHAFEYVCGTSRGAGLSR